MHCHSGYKHHIKAKHEEVLYSCDKYEYKATQAGHLKSHIESIHEGVYYSCYQCEYKAMLLGSLTTQVVAKHEESQYFCDQCKYKVEIRKGLIYHIETIHKEIRYSYILCHQCNFKATKNIALKHMLRQLMKKHDIIVISVDIKQQKKETLRNMLS